MKARGPCPSTGSRLGSVRQPSPAPQNALPGAACPPDGLGSPGPKMTYSVPVPLSGRGRSHPAESGLVVELCLVVILAAQASTSQLPAHCCAFDFTHCTQPTKPWQAQPDPQCRRCEARSALGHIRRGIVWRPRSRHQAHHLRHLLELQEQAPPYHNPAPFGTIRPRPLPPLPSAPTRLHTSMRSRPPGGTRTARRVFSTS